MRFPRTWRPRRWPEVGSTLLELMIAIGVLGVASVIFLAFFVSQNRLTDTQDRMYAQQQWALYALRTIEDGLLNVGYAHTGTDFVAAQDTFLDAYVSNSGRLSFRHDQTQKQLLRNSQVIYPEMNVVGLDFNYYDSSGSALTTPVSGGNLANIRQVEVELQVLPVSRQTDLGNRSTLTFKTRVTPPNLQLN